LSVSVVRPIKIQKQSIDSESSKPKWYFWDISSSLESSLELSSVGPISARAPLIIMDSEQQVHIGVLALQGAFQEHVAMLQNFSVCAIEVRLPEDLKV
jgi:hypothetical protein